MPTMVGILNFISRINTSYKSFIQEKSKFLHNFTFYEEHGKCSIASRPRYVSYMLDLDMRKPVMGVSDNVTLKPACLATKTS